jgi:predicted histone-like DNA-binding protein
MPIPYKLYQDTRDGSKTQGKWFARRVSLGVLSTDELAAAVQANVSVKKSDVKAVLEELSYVMNQKMKEGYVVRLDGIGLFYITIKSDSATLEELKSGEKTIRDLILDYKAKFREEVKNGVRPFGGLANGNSVRRIKEWDDPTTEEDESEEEEPSEP